MTTYDAMRKEDFVGLDIPPLDVGAFDIDMSTTDLTKFFDEIDDGCGLDQLKQFDGMVQCQNNKDSQRRAENKKTEKHSHGGRGKELRVLMEVLKPNNLSYSSELISKSTQKRVVVQALKASSNLSCSRPELKKKMADKKLCDKSTGPIRKEVECIPRQKVTEAEDTLPSDLNFKSPRMRMLMDGHKPTNLSSKSSTSELQKMGSIQHVSEKSIIPVRKEAENVTAKKKTRPEDTSDLKFKTTQKRLHEAYEQAETSKKQRRIQIIDYVPVPMERSCYRKNHLRLDKSFRPYAISQY